MKRNLLQRYLNLLGFLLLCLFTTCAFAKKEVIVLTVANAITPAIQDYIQQGINTAEENNSQLIIIRLDTPGGLQSSMLKINQAILASKIPVVTYVSPQGARAASAGTYIMYASHVAAMAPGTELGAASPIQIGGSESDAKSTAKIKAMNDAAAYIRSLAEIYKRNADWAEKSVREGLSLSAENALKLNVIDMMAKDIPELLQKLNNRPIKVSDSIQTLKTNDLTILEIKPNWRFDFLAIITDPTIAYILLLIGIYGLFFEFSSPGFIAPGVIGVISLLLALYAFQLLPVNYVALSLILVGIAFLVAEMMVVSYGALAIGGIIAFVVGSIMLFDTHTPGFDIALNIIVMMTVLTIIFFLLVIKFSVSALRKKVTTGREALLGAKGIVITKHPDYITVKIQGEIWNAQDDADFKVGESIVVTKVDGLRLSVRRLEIR